MKILNITYVPETNSIQLVIQFIHKDKELHTVVLTDSSSIPSDFLLIEASLEFAELVTEAINKKIDELENKKDMTTLI